MAKTRNKPEILLRFYEYPCGQLKPPSWEVRRQDGDIVIVPQSPAAIDLAERLAKPTNVVLANEPACKFSEMWIFNRKAESIAVVSSPTQLQNFVKGRWQWNQGDKRYEFIHKYKDGVFLNLRYTSSRVTGDLIPQPMTGNLVSNTSGDVIWRMKRLAPPTPNPAQKNLFRWPKSGTPAWASGATSKWTSAAFPSPCNPYVAQKAKSARKSNASKSRLPTQFNIGYAKRVVIQSEYKPLNFNVELVQEIEFESKSLPLKATYTIDCQIRLQQKYTVGAWISAFLGPQQTTDPVFQEMHSVRRGDPLSVLPTISLAANNRLRTWFSDYKGAVSTENLESDIDFALQLRHKGEPAVLSTNSRLTFPALQLTGAAQGQVLKFDSQVQAWRNGQSNNNEPIQDIPDDGTLFELILQTNDNDGTQIIRDGAFEFDLVAASAEEVTPGLPYRNGRIRIVLQAADDMRPVYPWQLGEFFKRSRSGTVQKTKPLIISYAVEDLRLGVAAVRPVGEDLPPGDEYVAAASLGAEIEGAGTRHEAPLIIPLSPPPAKAKGAKFWLVANESINSGQSLRLDFQLEPIAKVGVAATETRMVVLHSEPQLVSMIESRFLFGDANSLGATAIARRSPLSIERNGWELLDPAALSKGFLLWLPAQGIGEEVIKWKENYGDQPVDFRFSPPAFLRIAPTRVDRQYVAVPWNLRRILGQVGQSSPGAPLLRADFELLYGLAARLETEGTFITELGTKLGEIPVPSTGNIFWDASRAQRDEFLAARSEYEQIYKAWLTRLMILEPWKDVPFAPFEVKQGITYNARVIARKDISDSKPPHGGADLAQPWILKYLPSGPPVDPDKHPHYDDPEKPDELNEFKQWAKFHPRLDQEGIGLKGGFHYGFESKAIYSELARNWQESSSGEIANLAFSSAGGWGRQTARFAKDKTVIQSLTTMGRTHMYAVERIGRIAVYWNKAKHVILYERSVVPTRQFAPYQKKTSGRPFLRKVREYIELLEPERQFPDFGETDNRLNAGSVKRLSFPKTSTRINVNTCWSHDVYPPGSLSSTIKTPIGWEIPLWRPGEDPEVYPKPQIHLGFLPPPDADVDVQSGTIANPQDLYFYTSVKDADSANVYVWDAVPGVDYSIQPDPQIWDISPCGPSGRDSIDWPLPDPLAVHPGFERFTFQVVDSGPIKVAGRDFPKSTLNGRVRNLTMMRGAPVSPLDWKPINDPDSDKWRRTLEKLSLQTNGSPCLLNRLADAGSFAAPAAMAAGTGAMTQIVNQIDQWHTEFSKSINEVSDAIKNQVPAVDPDVIGKYKSKTFSTLPAQWLWKEANESVNAILTRVTQYTAEAFVELSKRVESFTEQGAALTQRIALELVTLKSRLQFATYPTANIQLGLSAVLQLLDSAFGKVKSDVLESVNTPLDAAVASLEDISDATQDAITAANKILVNAQTGVVPTLEQASEWLERQRPATTLKPQDVLGDYFGTQTWADTANSVLTALIAAVQTAKNSVQVVSNVLNASTEEVRLRLQKARSSLREVQQQLCGEVLHQLAALRDAADLELKQVADDLEKALAKLDLKPIEAAIQNLIGVLKGDLDKASASIEKVAAAIRDFCRDEIRSNLIIKPVTDGLGQFLDYVADPIGNLNNLIARVEASVMYALNPLRFLADKTAQDLRDKLATIDRLKRAIDSGDPNAILQESVNLANELNQKFGQAAGQVAQETQRLMNGFASGGGVVKDSQQVLRNSRALFDELTAPGMGFNRKTIALVLRTDWKNLDERLGITPLMARVKEFSQQLEGMGLRLPVVGLSDKLLSAAGGQLQNYSKSLIENFDVSSLFSDIGGMQFDKFLPGLKMPNFGRDGIKITHGFDKQKLSAWVKAESDVLIPGMKTLLPLGPLEILINNPHFRGQTMLTADADGRVQKVVRGELIGDWQINFSGIGLVIFRDFQVLYDGDRLKFNMDPSRIESPGLLQIITEAINAYQGGAGSLPAGVIKQDGIPVGYQTNLEIGPFDMGGGVSGVTGILVGGSLELRAFDERFNFDFSVATGVHFGRRDAPFNIIVMILGGGGFVDTRVLYKPLKNELTVVAMISVHASASFAIALGWIKGSVSIRLGLLATYFKPSHSSAGFSLTVFLEFEGSVTILSLVTVYLLIRLEMTYHSIEGGNGSELIGAGMVRIEIRICAFFKISLSKQYSKTFSRSGGSYQSLVYRSSTLAFNSGSPTYIERAQSYLVQLNR